MSLRLRLALLFLGLFLLGMAAVMTRSIETARREVRSEFESARLLTTGLLGLLFEQARDNLAPAQLPAFLERLNALDAARHFDVRIDSADNDYSLQDTPGNGSGDAVIQAPRWFVHLLALDAGLLVENHGEIGDVTIITRLDSSDEINEIWQKTQGKLIISTLGLSLFSLLSYAALTYWLRPLNRMGRLVDGIARSDYSQRLPGMRLPELDQLGRKINHLLGALSSSKADNDRLVRLSLSVQEQQCRYFAQELHDSLGQSVSAIKAIAASIAVRTRNSAPEIADSALRIEGIADTAYDSVRDLMTWLHPALLDELGLQPALVQMVDEWNVHHEDSFCKLRIETSLDDLDGQQQINLYRIVQEALTNVAKYAEASRVSAVLSGQENISLVFSDNGKGFDPGTVVMGMGLNGIRDRVNLLRGSFEILARPGTGTSLHMEFPRNPGYRSKPDDATPS